MNEIARDIVQTRMQIKPLNKAISGKRPQLKEFLKNNQEIKVVLDDGSETVFCLKKTTRKSISIKALLKMVDESEDIRKAIETYSNVSTETISIKAKRTRKSKKSSE